MRRRLTNTIPLATVLLGLVAGLTPASPAAATSPPAVGAGSTTGLTAAATPAAESSASPSAAAAAPARGVARYAALGDSYSSGEGNPPFDPGTDEPLDRCHRSPAGWPRIIARQDPRIGMVGHIACSGATSRDLRHWYNSEPPQLRQLASRRADLVTITIGGNDVGFGQVLADCFASDCVLDGGLARARWRIENRLPRHLSRAYRGLKAAAPGATLVVVGYPRLFPGTRAQQEGCRWLSNRERVTLNRLATVLDRTIKRSARRAGLHYVSVLRALNRHELCTKKSWVYPIGPFGGQLRGHPLRPGQRALAAVVRPRLDALL